MDIRATSSAQDTIVVEIETDDGLTGIGETDLNAWIARACIEAPATNTMDRGLKAMLLGRDASDPEALWRELYVGSAMTGRRGAVVNAIGAIDIALWDIAGQAAGVPTWRLLGDQGRDQLSPYASLQPEVSSFDAYLESMVAWATRAREIGFTAAKLEATFSGPYAHKGLEGPDEWIERGGSRGPRCRRPGHDTDGRRPVRLRLGASARCAIAERSPPTTSSFSRRHCGPTTRRLRRADGDVPRPDRAGEWLTLPPRVRAS